MKKLIVATVAALSALASMAYDTPLVLEITGTKSLTAALGGQSLAGHDALVKSGAGTLTIGSADVTAISSFDGDVVVSGGVLKISAEGALGTAAGKTVVEGNAQLYIDSAASDLDFTAETMEISGEGPDGKGAIFTNNKVNNAHNFGSVKLVDDATIGYATTCTFNQYNTSGICDLNGKTLTFRTSAMKIISVYGTFSAGNVLLDNAKMIFASTATFEGTAENSIATTNKGILAYNWYRGSVPLTLRPLETSLMMEVRNAGDAGTYNIYAGPVDLDRGNIVVTKTADAQMPGCSFSGKISGSYGILSQAASAGLTIRLTNSENDFTGGVSIDGSTLVLPVNGAVPAEGGPLFLKDATLSLTEDVVYDLPDVVLDGICKISPATICAKSITKLADSTQELTAIVTTPVLDLRGGTLKVVGSSKRPTPGLTGGIVLCADADAAKARYDKKQDLTEAESETVLSPVQAYRCGTKQGWGPNMLSTYTGYIWNNAEEPQNWTFAACVFSKGSVWLDGELVCESAAPANMTAAWGGPQQKTVEVTPGAHRIDIRMYTGAIGSSTSTMSGGGAYHNTKLTDAGQNFNGYVWASYRGIVLDRQGRGLKNASDYENIVDPGDGSLLTRTNEDVPSSVFETVIATNDVATLDLCGKDHSVKKVIGFPSVADCGTFAIAESLAVGRDAYAGKAMTADGKVTFGEGAKVVVDFGGRFRPTAGSVTILTATDGIVGEPTLEVAAGIRGTFSLRKSDDGKSLWLDYKPNGMVLLFR